MNRISNFLWGLVFVVVGVVFGLNALEITDIDIFFDGWWTLFIIVPCFIGLFKDEDKNGNLIGLIIGICLLFGCLDIISFALIWKLMVPVILVIIGLSFMFKDVFRNDIRKKVKSLSKEGSCEYCATFGNQIVDFNKEKFNGCNLTAVFGGVKCDLRRAIIEEDVVISVSAIFGGITIYVPEDINVKFSVTPIFGGVSDDRKNIETDGKYTIYLQATTMFGGVEIK